jgi:probable HAF family extracellular repeat protein
MTDLGNLGGTSSPSVAHGINNSGQVVGVSYTSSGNGRAFLYSGGVMTNLGTLGGATSAANGINNSGQVVGESLTSSGNTNAFLYSGGTMTDIGTLGDNFSIANGINSSGQVVGVSETHGGTYDAFLYSGGSMIDIGGAASSAIGINNSGEVVGAENGSNGNSYAFLYTSGTGLEDLNTLYASLLVSGTGTKTGFTSLLEATSINSSGEIAGYGNYYNGTVIENQAFLLSPAAVPEPSTWALMLGGLGATAIWTRLRRKNVALPA